MALSMQNSPELTQEEVKKFLLQPLNAASVVLANGPVVYDSPTGAPLTIPRLIDAPEGSWYGENELIADVDPDFAEFHLLPSNLKSIKVYHKFSNELARHSIVPIASTLQAALVRQIAAKMDTQFLVGTGATDGNGNITPTGIVNQADVQTSTWDETSGASLQDSADAAIGKLVAAEITDLSRCVWFVNSADYIGTLAVRDSDERSYLVPDLTQAGNYTLRGIRVVPTSKLPVGTKVLADMSKVAVGRDLAPSARIFTETHAQYDQLAIRVVTRMDIGLLYPEGVVVIS